MTNDGLADLFAQGNLLSLIVAACVLLGGFWLARRLSRLSTTERASEQALQEAARLAEERAAETELRLKMMAEQQAAQQSQLIEALRRQERAIGQSLDQRINGFARQVNDRLHQTSSQQSTTLNELRERLAVIDRAQRNITELSSQVTGLQDILSNKQARGAFGEVQLRDIVTSVLPPSAYVFHPKMADGKVPDCILQLPNPPGPIVIDAKFPLESYKALAEAADDQARLTASRGFSQDLKKHIKDIAEKYIRPGETADSALMFLPSEAVYAELHANFSNLVEESFRQRVWIVSPTTLMATLNTVRAIMRDLHIQEQAGAIRTEVERLLADVTRLGDRVQRLEGHFDQAGRDIREIRISADKISKRGLRLTDLELEEVAAELPEPAVGPRLVEKTPAE